MNVGECFHQKTINTGSQPYLSIVVAARNDNHGGDMLKRMQIFTNGILAQAEKFRLPCELIVVEWNPPAGKPPLAEALKWPESSDQCRVRFIVFPPELHNRYKHASQLPLYQMIAKNVGIRRARGEFVIATNIDILFSDELFAFMASRQLDPQRMYRCQRHDVNEEIPLELSHDEHLAYCRANIVRTNTRYGSRDLITGDFAPCNSSDEPVLHGIANLHTNACGDFTMLSRQAWWQLHGYPEFDMYSFHLDSLLCYMAHYAGFREIDLAPPLLTYHIEHGGGFKPKDETLDKTLAQRKVMRMSDAELSTYGRFMNSRRKPVVFCDDAWGLATEQLPEYSPYRYTDPDVEMPVPHASLISPSTMRPDVTIFTTPLPFTGDALVCQRNALRNWQLHFPGADIFLIGTAEGTSEAAAELGVQHLPVEANPFGSISVADLLHTMNDNHTSGLYLYLEPDLLVSSDLPEILCRLQELDRPFIAAGQNYLSINWAEMSFCHPALSEILQESAREKGIVSAPYDPGYFVFNCSDFGYVPPFTTSSSDWKVWLMAQALSTSRLLIDLTPSVTVSRQWKLEARQAGDVQFNKFLGGKFGTTLIDASHRFSGHKLKKGDEVPFTAKPDTKNYWRFFFWLLEEARIYGNWQLGLKLAEEIEPLITASPEVLYQLHIQRGKLFLVAVQYRMAAEEFLKAIALDPDENLPAVGLYRSIRFTEVSGQYFVSEHYNLTFDLPEGMPLPQRALLEEELMKASELYSQQRVMAALNVLQGIDTTGTAITGLNMAIALCLAQSEQVKEALFIAESELHVPCPHPDAGRLVKALRQSVEIPTGAPPQTISDGSD